MKQKRNVYIITLIIASILISGLIAVISILSTRRILRDHAAEVLELQCQKAVVEFDALLENLEQSVNTITLEAVYCMDDFERFKTDPEYVKEYTEHIYGLMLFAARNTKGTMSAYIRYNPELTGPSAGAFLTRDDETGDFADTQITNLYDPDGEDIVWWTAPVEAGEAVWIGPYHNYNVNYNMISYVTPYYHDGELVGIIGMDIDYEYIKELIGSIRAFETGFGVLVAEDGQVVVHKNYDLFEYMEYDKMDALNAAIKEEGASGSFHLEHLKQTMAYSTTKNNMILGMLVPDNEIYAVVRQLVQYISVAGVVALAGFSLLTVWIIRKLYRLAENDELTGIYNRKYFMTAFSEWNDERKGSASLFLFDIDSFKQINDDYGHNTGDFALKEVAKLAGSIIGNNYITARWGGDEFIGIVPKDKAAELLEALRAAVEQLGKDNNFPLTISVGYVDMVPGQELKGITDHADKALYKSKKNGKNKVTRYK